MDFFLFTAFLAIGLMARYQYKSQYLAPAFICLLVIFLYWLNFHATDPLNLSW